jgi:iron complex outermembrane receptor protein
MKIAKSALATFIATCLPLSQAVAQALEEILVTAQRRVESLSDVPISVSAMTGTKLNESGIQRPEDFSMYVPNFAVTQDPIGDKINIRGIQSGNLASFEQSVATFVDGIYRSRGTQTRWSFLDLERIEVLRGPQPTLFGKNTVAGALNITTARPTDELDGEISTTYNPEFDETEIRAFISGPLSETVRGRLVFLDRQLDEGWVRNTAYPEDNPSSEEFMLRGSIEWDVTEDTLAFLRVEKGDFDVTGQPWSLVHPGPITSVLEAGGIPLDNRFETSMGNNGFAPFGLPGDPVLDFESVGKYKGETEEAVLRVDHTLNNGLTVTGIAGYTAYDFDRFLDADFNPLPVVRYDDTEDFDQTSFELRLTSDTGGDVEYIAGMYYLDSDLYVDGLAQWNLTALDFLLGGACGALPGGLDAITIGDPVTTAVAAAELSGSTAAASNACALTSLTQLLIPAGAPGAARYAYLDQNTESLAFFGQSTWSLTDAFRLTLGLRHTDEEKSASKGAYAAGYAERDNTALADTSLANPQALASYIIGEFTEHSFVPSDPGMTRNESNLAWSVNAQWDAADNAMLYAAAATGYKAGGFNSFYMGLPQGGGALSSEAPFEEEEVFSFEVGAKLSLLNGAAELNIAAFNTSYDDLQVAIFSGDTTFVVQNAAEATSRGIEIDGRWNVNANLMLLGSFGWLDFEYDDFVTQGCVAEQYLNYREEQFQAALAAGDPAGAGAASLLINNQSCSNAGVNDVTGRVSAHSPDFSASFVLDYRKSFRDYELGVITDLNWIDDVYRQDDLDPISLQPAFTKINTAISWGPIDGNWDIALVARNITDEDTASYINDTPLFNGSRQAYIDPPRSVAGRLRLRF